MLSYNRSISELPSAQPTVVNGVTQEAFVAWNMRISFACVWLCLTTVVCGFEIQTCGKSGKACGETNCLAGVARCNKKEKVCECRPIYSALDGDFQCYRQNKRFAEIRNDPIVRTFDEHTYKMVLPCRYHLTHVITFLKVDHKDRVGTCECEVSAWNKKHRGKVYPAGYDFACKVHRTVGNPKFSAEGSIRITGEAENGCYNFTEWGNSRYRLDGPWYSTPTVVDTNGFEFFTTYNKKNNFAEVDVRACGIRVGLRPFDQNRGSKQVQPSGLYIAVNCANHPEFLNQHVSMAPAPREHGGIPFKENIVPGLTAKESYLIRMMEGHVEQSQPDAADECFLLPAVVHHCVTSLDKKKAMDSCLWILEEPRFVRCVDTGTNGNELIRLFRQCYQAACGSWYTCQEFVQFIFETGCDHVPGIALLTEYISGIRCPSLHFPQDLP